MSIHARLYPVKSLYVRTYVRNTAGHCSNASLVASHLVVASTRTIACTDTRKEQLLYTGSFSKTRRCNFSNERKYKNIKIKYKTYAREIKFDQPAYVFNRMYKVFSSKFSLFIDIYFLAFHIYIPRNFYIQKIELNFFLIMFRYLICFAFIVISRARNVLNCDGFNKKKKKQKYGTQGLSMLTKTRLAKMKTGLITGFQLSVRDSRSIFTYGCHQRLNGPESLGILINIHVHMRNTVYLYVLLSIP